ncbi:MAG TPA: hypothetical protein PKL77_09145 [Candidatus Omnitrophota bacterium]|nr:hypothetical protein [Candidatus Omnitrophota bacterium]HPT06923.1 hypothetical protein [Candidatus Omnitrophota bacterium]
MPISKLIVPLGIAGYSCVFLAVLTGLLIFQFHLRWIKLKWHIWLGFAAFILATLHAALVIVYR